MEQNSLRLLIFCVLVQACLSYKITVLTPRVVYYDSNTVASVSAAGVHSKTEVTLQYRGVNNKDVILNSTTLEFDSDGSQEWGVIFPWNYLQELEETSVQLSMTSGSEHQTMILVFAKNFGHIFIQTDKPIYTPRQTVKYRVIAVDEQQRLAKYKIKVEIKNHEQVIIDCKNNLTAEEAFRTQEIDLPKEVPPGLWSINASFEGLNNAPGSAHIVNFEVKDYDLAKFSTVYQIHPNVITKSTKQITIHGSTNYFYNKHVEGTADLQIGVWDSFNGKQIYQNVSTKLSHGNFTQDFPVNKLFPSLDSLKDKRFYMKLTVTEKVTGESEFYYDATTSFSYSDYVINFERSKNFFRPGFNYTLQFQVSNKNARLDKTLNANIKYQYYISKSLQSEGNVTTKLDNIHAYKSVNYFHIPADVDAIHFKVTFEDQADCKRCIHQATKYSSTSKQYIHISYTSKKKNEIGTIHLYYTQPEKSNMDVNLDQDTITVLVLSKGHIIFTTSFKRNSNGTSSLKLPSNLATEISPRIRIIAFYMHRNKDYVIDSLVVDINPVCIEKIELFDVGEATELHKPGDSFILTIRGVSNMLVGLVAVDKAVFHKQKPILTRESMFAQLGSHDSGSQNGDGNNMEDILTNSGLQYKTLTVEMRAHASRGDFMVFYDTVAPKQLESKMMNSAMSSARQMANYPEYSWMELPQTTRDYFPESWLFKEIILPKTGIERLNLTFPDSTTTWSFMAIGVSENRGVCMSEPLDQQVLKLFFADVRLPYKVKRLEEVLLNITIYNYNVYPVHVTGTITYSEGLCFAENTDSRSTHNTTTFKVNIRPKDSFAKPLKVVPLYKGDISILVDLQTNKQDYDRVEKKLHVVAEGQRVKKSITFVLDPEAKHAGGDLKTPKKITFSESATVNNVYDIENKQQQTTINLALPVEVIKGTEFCQISAFGDLMGDIINSVVESKNLLDNPLLDAEEVLGDLAPTVYALLYANYSGLMNEKLREKGRKVVRNGVLSLLPFRLPNNAFALTKNGTPATWLTAFVLKTMCHAASLTFIDRENLIDKGFNWLSQQVNPNGTLNEKDWRLANDSLEYRIMLGAEVLIAILECKKTEKEQHVDLVGEIITFLDDHIEHITEPMVLAKVTYALMLIENEYSDYKEALERLQEMKRKNNQDYIYWSNTKETEEVKDLLFWYNKGAKASSIEATAYALLVYVNRRDSDADAIADWLVGQRNSNGAFIGAMDSTAAIQALSKYSLYKHGVKVDLSCDVSSDRSQGYFHSFKFTEENATYPKSLNNVPVGEVLDVITKGQGLGQMQVNVEYNIPIEKNKKCAFDVRARALKADVSYSGSQINSICESCKIGCPKVKKDVADGVKVKVDNVVVLKACKKLQPPYPDGSPCKKAQKKRKKPTEKKEKDQKIITKHRVARDITNHVMHSAHNEHHQATSKKLICVHVCIQHRKKTKAGPTEVQIEMLTGYRAITSDLEMIQKMDNIKYVVYDNSTDVLKIHFKEISCEKTCITFRAAADASVGRLMNAVIQVIQVGTTTPQCVKDYDPPRGQESLQIFCANNKNNNKGECRCLSGLCSTCKTIRSDNSLEIQKDVCNSAMVYKLQLEKIVPIDKSWVEIDARLISVIKAGSENITEGSIIKLTTQEFCSCLAGRTDRNNAEIVYMLAGDVIKFEGKKEDSKFQYLLNEDYTFLTKDNSKNSLLQPVSSTDEPDFIEICPK